MRPGMAQEKSGHPIYRAFTATAVSSSIFSQGLICQQLETFNNSKCVLEPFT